MTELVTLTIFGGLLVDFVLHAPEPDGLLGHGAGPFWVWTKLLH